jgi:acyl-CoA reductase-like NAD-dependent aldehyde dehydrogenase
MNRGQVLYRAAEMMDARRAEFTLLLGGGQAARREVDACVDAWIWYAGWTDKLAQVAGTVNPVAGPYFNFTIPEPTGVVGIVAPDRPALLPLVRRLAAVLCGGNTCVAVVSEASPLPALVLGEVLGTSDLPAGAANLLSGQRRELVSWLAAHMDVNAVDAAGCSDEELSAVETAAAANVKRVVRPPVGGELSPQAVTAFMELKTVWHPIGV